MVNLQIALKWLGTWVALVLLSIFTTRGVQFASPDPDPGAVQITLALCLSFLSILLTPVGSGHKTRAGAVLLWSVMAAAGFFSLSSSPIFAGQGKQSLELAGGVLILVLLFGAIQSLIRTYTPSHASSMTLFTLIAAFFFAAPLYLGVVAETTSHQGLVDFIVAASPLSYLAGIANFDYLRSNWFYQHTPFGGLRFNYPAPGIMTICYVIITLVLAGANILKNKTQSGTKQ